MNIRFGRAFGVTDEIGRDVVLEEHLAKLDPGSTEPGYWLRFHRDVMARAAGALAQRRLVARVTVADIVTSWSRMIVPTAALAAAMAGVMLLRSSPEEPAATASAAFAIPIEAEPAPVLLSPSQAVGFAALRTDDF